MKYKEFEKHIKSELNNSTMTVDVDNLINKIHPVNKNRKVVFLLFGLFALTMTLLTTSLYSFSKNKKSETKITAPNESRIIINPKNNEIAKTENQKQGDYAWNER